MPYTKRDLDIEFHNEHGCYPESVDDEFYTEWLEEKLMELKNLINDISNFSTEFMDETDLKI